MYPSADPNIMSPEKHNAAKPALKALLGSYARWKADKDRRGPHPERTSLETLTDHAKNHNLPPPPRSVLLLAQLPTTIIADLPDDEQRCAICLDSYFKDEHGEKPPETPLRLPCGHVVGNRCFRKWIFPYADGETCPICRADCLLEDLGLNLEDLTYKDNNALEIAVDESIWGDHEGGRPLSNAERARLKGHRYRIVVQRLADAWKEVNDDHEKFGLPSRVAEADQGGSRAVILWRERLAVIARMANEVAMAFDVCQAELEVEDEH